ncbi:MAG: peptidase S10 [Proteobacteria bacterium]|nr:peptidase S10 [Pseudomonadota bacterium]
MLVLACALLVAACNGGGGDSANSGGGTTFTDGYADPVAYSSAASASLASAVERAAVTHHTLTVGSQTLAYTATAGHLTARAPVSAQDEASMFYVAYTLDGQAPAQRPVTIFYNGGPGSATAWLHLGSFGPVRLATGMPATTTATPYAQLANAQSLLDVSDLVFVDAVGTGYSEAIAPFRNNSFYGVDADAQLFRDFVVRYLAANGRTASPLYLFGESYGTTRSAVLAYELATAGVPVTGVVLQSSILDYNKNCGVTALRLNCAPFFPSYGAVGAWHGVDSPNPDPAQLPTFVDSLRTQARNTFIPALDHWLNDGVLPAGDVLADLANTTGLALGYWQQEPDVPPGTYAQRLIAGMSAGIYDGRVLVPASSPLAAKGNDPSSTAITPGFAQGIASYLANTLHYTSVSTYVLVGDAINHWQFAHAGNPLPDTIPDLAAAFTLNPALRVLSLNGYHDLATPAFETILDLERLPATAHVTVRSYVGGHMTYLDDASQAAEKSDLAAFYAGTLQ